MADNQTLGILNSYRMVSFSNNQSGILIIRMGIQKHWIMADAF